MFAASLVGLLIQSVRLWWQSDYRTYSAAAAYYAIFAFPAFAFLLLGSKMSWVLSQSNHDTIADVGSKNL
jgi:uncharacterized BrkB/YihY/UPF0761 family membrane protein